jgi:hypothetical protein
LIAADFGNSEFIARWTMERLQLRLAAPYWAFGFLLDGELRAGVVLNGWNGANVDLTTYAPGMFNRLTLRATFAYVFEGLKATRITARTRVTNARMRDILPRVGYVLEGTAPRYYGPGPEGDALVFGMLADQCPWLRGSDGRARPARSQRNGRSPSGDEQGNGDHPVRAGRH